MLRQDGILDALNALGTILEERDISFNPIVLGGANLLVSGVIARPTVDVDVIAQRGSRGELLHATPLPPAVESAVQAVAHLQGLPTDWLNSMAGSEIQFGVPDGCMSRLQPQRFGGMTVWWIDRRDLIAYKLVAAVDHLVHPVNKHLEDLLLLQPTDDDLAHGVAWFKQITAPTSAAFAGLAQVLEGLGYEY